MVAAGHPSPVSAALGTWDARPSPARLVTGHRTRPVEGVAVAGAVATLVDAALAVPAGHEIPRPVVAARPGDVPNRRLGTRRATPIPVRGRRPSRPSGTRLVGQVVGTPRVGTAPVVAASVRPRPVLDVRGVGAPFRVRAGRRAVLAVVTTVGARPFRVTAATNGATVRDAPAVPPGHGVAAVGLRPYAPDVPAAPVRHERGVVGVVVANGPERPVAAPTVTAAVVAVPDTLPGLAGVLLLPAPGLVVHAGSPATLETGGDRGMEAMNAARRATVVAITAPRPVPDSPTAVAGLAPKATRLVVREGAATGETLTETRGTRVAGHRVDGVGAELPFHSRRGQGRAETGVPEKVVRPDEGITVATGTARGLDGPAPLVVAPSRVANVVPRLVARPGLVLPETADTVEAEAVVVASLDAAPLGVARTRDAVPVETAMATVAAVVAGALVAVPTPPARRRVPSRPGAVDVSRRLGQGVVRPPIGDGAGAVPASPGAPIEATTVLLPNAPVGLPTTRPVLGALRGRRPVLGLPDVAVEVPTPEAETCLPCPVPTARPVVPAPTARRVLGLPSETLLPDVAPPAGPPSATRDGRADRVVVARPQVGHALRTVALPALAVTARARVVLGLFLAVVPVTTVGLPAPLLVP